MLPPVVKIMCIFIDIIGIIICLLLRNDFGASLIEVKNFDKKLFNQLVFYTVLVLGADAVSWALTGLAGYAFFNFIATAIYFTLHISISSVWIVYCDYILNESEARSKKLQKLFYIPTAIVAFLSLLSYKYPILFTITKDNVYHRGDYYLIFIAFCSALIFYSIYTVTKKIVKDKKKDKNNKKLIILLVYPVLPIAGMTIQTLYYGVNITWILTTVSLIIVYFNFQNALLIIDPLTKINNRYSFENYIENHFDNHYDMNKDKFMAIVDLNDFKLINDQFGHLEGDKALEVVADILKNIADKDDFVARLGGDEFIIFGEAYNTEEIMSLTDKIYRAVDLYNDSSSLPYRISLSIGYAIQNRANPKTKDELFSEADRHMYKVKNENKLLDKMGV